MKIATTNLASEHVWVLVRPNGVTYYDRDNAETNNVPAAFSKPTSCDGQTNPAGHWTNSNQKPAISIARILAVHPAHQGV
jgi:hypothetical protein